MVVGYFEMFLFFFYFIDDVFVILFSILFVEEGEFLLIIDLVDVFVKEISGEFLIDMMYER